MTNLFDKNNTFCIRKNNGDVKNIKFSNITLQTLYYKLHRMNDEKYDLDLCNVKNEHNDIIMENFWTIKSTLIKHLNNTMEYTITEFNSDLSERVNHWANSKEELIEQLTKISSRINEYDAIRVVKNINDEVLMGTVSDIFLRFEFKEHNEEKKLQQESDMKVTLDFNSVLEELAPTIANGNEQEKREAKVILAYLAKKLAAQ